MCKPNDFYLLLFERTKVKDYEEWSEEYDEAPQFQKLSKKKKAPREKGYKDQRKEKRKEKEAWKEG